MKQIAIPFFWALILSILLGLCLSGVLFWLDWPWWYYPLALATYTVWWGWVDAKDMLARRLGNKPKGLGVVHHSRVIPVNTQEGVVFNQVMSWARGKVTRGIEVDSGYTLYSADCQVDEARANRFIRRAYVRQIRGKHPLSRNYWTKSHRPAYDRYEYECIVGNLVDFGFVTDRAQGRSGKLNTHCERIISKLQTNLK